MKLVDFAKENYTGKGKNCAEAILLAGNKYYNLGLAEDSAKLLVGFGGGIGCGLICGCLAGSVAVLGQKFSDRADFRALCAEFAKIFKERLGCDSIDCAKIVPKYKTAERKCEQAVLVSAELLEEFIANIAL